MRPTYRCTSATARHGPPTATLLLTALAALVASSAAAAADVQRTATVSLHQVNIAQPLETANGGLLGALRPDPHNPGVAIGFLISCIERDGLSINANFGPFPRGVPVTFAVTDPSGKRRTYGPTIIAYDGVHEATVLEPEQQSAFIDQALRFGAVIENGHRRLANRLHRDENAALRQIATVCLKHTALTLPTRYQGVGEGPERPLSVR